MLCGNAEPASRRTTGTAPGVWACGAGLRDKWVDRMPVIMRTWSWLTPTSDWSRAMRGLESVCSKTPARCPLFERGVVNRLGRANLSVAQNGPAISAS
jgi:hypothetical protein